MNKVPKSIGNIKKTKAKKVVHNRPTAPERVNTTKIQNHELINAVSKCFIYY